MRINRLAFFLLSALSVWPSRLWAGGTAVVQPSTIDEGTQVSYSTMTYIVPTGNWVDGAAIKIHLPYGWGPYLQTTNSNQSGYVVATSSPSRTLSVVAASTEAAVAVVLSPAQSLSAGSTVYVVLKNLYTTCPLSGQSTSYWTIYERLASTDTFTLLAAAPTQTLMSGPARWLGFSPWDPLVAVANQTSSTITVQGTNSCGRPAAVSSSVVVNVAGFLSDYTTFDSGAEISTSPTFNVITSTLTISTGTTQTSFFYRTSTVSNALFLKAAYLDLQYASLTSISRSVNVLASAVTFSEVSVDSGTSGGSLTSFTLTPDGDGSNDFAFIRFTPSNSAVTWRVAISSDGFNTVVFERWGSANPGGTVQWDGRRQYGAASNSIVPNGTYAVRIEIPGLLTVNTLSITVAGVSISGQVRLGAAGVSGAWVNAQAVGAPGYSGTFADSNGNFVLNGLKSGQAYNLYTHFYDPNTQTPLNGSLQNISAPATGADISFSQPAKIRIAASLSSAAGFTTYGQVSARTSDFSRFYNGTLRFVSGNTTSDNGDGFSPSTWTVLVVQPGSYNLTLEVPGFATQTSSVTIAAGQTQDVGPLTLTPKAVVYGKISLPSPVTQPYGLWIPVDGVKSGQTSPSVWGGAYFNVGQSSAIYQVFNVEAGVYAFRARVQGYIPVSVSTTVAGVIIGNSVSGGVDFSSGSFSTGGSITGTLTVQGNSLSQGTTLYLWLSAYNASLGVNEFTQITLPSHAATSNTSYQISGLENGTYQVFPPYLYGFELTPPGPKSVVVSGGVGTLNLTLLENSGQISGSVTLPGGQSDYSKVIVSINGPNISTTTTASAGSYAFSRLGTGHYSLVAYYETTGAQVRRTIAVVNGQTAASNLDLSIPTYAVAGNVSIQEAFTVQPSSGAAVTINTIADLLANDTTQYLYLNSVSSQVMTSRVEAFPKTFNTFGGSNRDGFSNTFNLYDFKYGLIQADGSYSISGLTPGVWEISIYPFLDGGTKPSFAVEKRILTISTASLSNVHFALTDGYSVSGTISLPSGATDNQTLYARIVTERGDTVQNVPLYLGSAGAPANSTPYEFKNLANGRYALVVEYTGAWDSILMRFISRYVAKPLPFEVAGVDIANLNLTLSKTSRIIGKISFQGKNSDGSPNTTLLTSNNTSLLPQGFRVVAEASPWVEGGYQEANRANGGLLQIDSNNQFVIENLVAGTYDVHFKQDSFGSDLQGQGNLNFASLTEAQIRVAEGQIFDMGTVELKQGLSLTGTVKDESGTALANIRVRAYSNSSRNGEGSETTTDAVGQFTLTGINPDLKTYNVSASPRPDLRSAMPSSGYGEVKKKAIDVTTTPLPAIHFVLSVANASLSGRVSTEDGGALSFPEEEQQGYPAAAIYLQRQGVPSSGDDPLGEIREATALDGTYTLSNLVPGTYEVTIISLEYKPYKFTTTLSAGSNSVSAITLEKGAVLTAGLQRTDGSGVNTQDVRFAVAATADLESILFGQIKSDDATRTIRSIRFSGFETGKRYSVLLFDDRDNITSPTEGRGLTFSSDNEDKTLTLTFQPSAPNVYSQVKKVGSAAQVSLYLSRALRSTQPSDDVASSMLSIVSGGGAISDAAIQSDRRSLTFTYTPAAGEETATLRFSAATADINPATGAEFPITKTFVLRFGQKAVAEQNINPIFGGEISLAEADSDPSSVNVPANALLTSTGAVADSNTNYSLTFTATEDLGSVPAGALSVSGARAAALPRQLARNAEAFVSEAYHAMRAAAASSINPLSSFYSVLLPAGLSHTLNNTATLTLQYDSGSDPTQINVYYYDGSKYLIENTNRTIDTVNRTITVGVSHFSTFVVLQNSASVVRVDGDASTVRSIEAFNFPNPFDLTSKTKTLNRGGSSTSLTTDGTIIRYSIPSSIVGTASIDIVDITGNRVRGIDLGAPSRDTYHYVTWDGKNDAGHNVASGVYLGVMKVGGEKKVWKMAVIK